MMFSLPRNVNLEIPNQKGQCNVPHQLHGNVKVLEVEFYLLLRNYDIEVIMA